MSDEQNTIETAYDKHPPLNPFHGVGESMERAMQATAKKSAIATQLDDLEECIADLKGEIGRLINKINPVLNPQMDDSTEAKREGVSEDEASEVARIIEYNRYRVLELTNLIRHTIDRLEI